MTQSNLGELRRDQVEIGHPSPEHVRAVNEVGAAIAHELNGPLTALLLYIGDLSQHSDQIATATCDGQSLKQVVENAFRETERVCFLIRRITELFDAPLQTETAIAHGSEIIRWWSRFNNASKNTQAGVQALRKPLTPREHEVLRLVSEGCSNKQGGQQMHISHRTFESHRAAVMRKFGAKNAADLIRRSHQSM
jgi:DNA-binding CsgD family transcriptional regulator